MPAWLAQNWGTILALAVIAGIVVAIVVSRIRARRAGESGCGCGCGQCAMRDTCHPTSEQKKK